MAPAARGIYENDVDFLALAAQDPAFAKKLKPNKQLDFSDPESVLFNYILWLQDLLDSTSADYRETYDPNRQVVGIDIGTGASAIYPLLACRQRPQWNMIATESDANSFEYANRNVSRNSLEDRIKIIKINSGGKNDPLVPESVLKRFERLDFLLTNPPFYPSTHSLLVSASRKSRLPNSICTGSESEMITPGGEVGFIRRLINQSARPDTRHKIQWWSSMLGKLSNVDVVVEMLKREGVRNWAVKEFVQGQKTRRWGVAWSWSGLRPASQMARGLKAKGLKRDKGSSGAGVSIKKTVRRKQGQAKPVQDEFEGEGQHDDGQELEAGLLPFPPEFEFEVRGVSAGMDTDLLHDVGRKIDSEIQNLEDMQWQWKPTQHVGLGIAQDGDCWSRRARRRKGKEKEGRPAVEDQDMEENGDEDDDGDEEKEPQLVFKIKVWRSPTNEENGKGGVFVTVRWLQGQDHVLFESFCGWLKRKIGS